jgi:hypothetical protein
MPESVRSLEFTEGFVGPPVPRVKTGAGCPEFQNLILTPEGASLMPMPGWRWTYPYPLCYKPYVGLHDIAGVKAAGDIVFSNQPSAADTITIGTQVYEFYAFEGSYEGSFIGVEIGSPALVDTLFNLSAMISANDTMQVNSLVNVAGQKVILTAENAGAKGNLINLAESSTVITVPATLTGGVDEDFGYAWYGTEGELTTSGDTPIEGKYLVVVFPPQALLTNGGAGLGIVDQVTGRIAALSFHPGGVAWDPTNVATDRIPRIVGHLNRQGAHDYPKLVPFKNLTFVISAYDEIRVWDGAELRLAGVRAPQTAPGIEIGNYEAPLIEAVWAGKVTPPAVIAAADMEQSTGRTGIRFGTDGDRIDVMIPFSENSVGEICYANGEQTASGSQKVIAVDIRYCDTNGTRDLPAGTLALVVGDSEASGAIGQDVDHTHTYLIEQQLKHKDIVRVDLTFDEEWPTLQAFGWRLEKTIPGNHFHDEPILPDHDVRFQFKLIYKSVSGSGLLAAGDYLIGFSWYDRKRMRESNLSLLGMQTLSGDNPVSVDLSGWKEGIVLGQLNSNPDPRHVDAVRVYLHKTDWGTDDYGYPQMRLYQEFDAPQPDEGRLWVYISAERDINDVSVDKEPEYERGVLPPSHAAVVDGDRLILGNQPSYSVGRVFNPMLSQVMYKARAWKTAAGLVCYADSTADPSGKTFRDDDYVADRWYNEADPDEHVWCDSDPSSLTFLEYPEAEPEWGPWFEGREIRFGTSGDKFTIVKALMNAEGEYDRLWVYRAEIDGSYSSFRGPWDEAVAYEITGQPNRLSWSVILPVGVYIEGVSQAGYQDLEMPGDEILALGRIGDFLAAIGRKMTVFLRQVSNVVDGSANPGNPFPGPRAIKGGTVSGRSLVEIGNRQGLFFSPEGKLMLATVEGVQEHPLSERFIGWITSQYRIDANMLRHCHAVWDPVRNWYSLFLGDSGIGPDGADTTDKHGDHPDAAPLDRYVDWAAPE